MSIDEGPDGGNRSSLEVPTAPLRVEGADGSRRGPSWLGAAAVMVAGALVIAVGLIGPDPGTQTATGPSRTAAATSSPRATPTSRAATPTPASTPLLAPALPKLVVFGPALDGRVLLEADGYRWLDLATGDVGPRIEGPNATLRRLADGTLLCVCREFPWGSTESVERLTIRRLDASGRPVGEQRTLTYEGHLGERDSPGVMTTSAISADGSMVVVAVAARLADGRWRFGAEAVPADPTLPTRSIELGVFADEPAIQFVAVPVVDIAPDGGTVAVNGWIDRGTDETDRPRVQRPRWFLRLGQGALEEPVALDPADIDARPTFCIDEGWISTSAYAEACVPWSTGPDIPALRIRLLDRRGELLAATTAPSQAGPAVPLIDSRAGAIHLWDGYGHQLFRMDVAGNVTTADGGSPRPVPPNEVVVRMPIASSQSIVYSPARNRIYAAGYATPRAEGFTSHRSTGIWVYDAESLETIGRAEPLAAHHALRVSDDGTVLFASAVGGITAAGEPSHQGPSITAYDIATGRARALYGQVSVTAGQPDFGLVQFAP